MKKYTLFICILFCSNSFFAQELFLMTEPASNPSAKSITVRVANYFMQIDSSKKISYHLMPDVTVGVSNNLMLRFSLVTSNRLKGLDAEGFNLYAKYRFLTNDDVHQHFRMATFARYTSNVSPIHMQENNLMMHNTGYEIGTVATKLLHKTAINASVSYQRAMSTNKNKFIFTNGQNSINYTLSVGKLILPKKYISYKQTNFNFMLEAIGQYNTGLRKNFIDIVPVMQFIFNSIACVDIAYRANLQNNMIRTYNKGIIIEFKYQFFNAFK